VDLESLAVDTLKKSEATVAKLFRFDYAVARRLLKSTWTSDSVQQSDSSGDESKKPGVISTYVRPGAVLAALWLTKGPYGVDDS
jgi:hypothetical protein